MAYEKQTWDTNSYVNPTRMNHIENGIKENSDNIDTLTQGASDMSTEISGIKQNIADLGGIELIANTNSTNSSNRVTFAKKLTEFRYICAYFGYGNTNNAASVFMPTAVFKGVNHTLMQASDTIGYIQSVNDNDAVIFNNKNTNYNVYVYGIK